MMQVPPVITSVPSGPFAPPQPARADPFSRAGRVKAMWRKFLPAFFMNDQKLPPLPAMSPAEMTAAMDVAEDTRTSMTIWSKRCTWTAFAACAACCCLMALAPAASISVRGPLRFAKKAKP